MSDYPYLTWRFAKGRASSGSATAAAVVRVNGPMHDDYVVVSRHANSLEAREALRDLADKPGTPSIRGDNRAAAIQTRVQPGSLFDREDRRSAAREAMADVVEQAAAMDGEL